MRILPADTLLDNLTVYEQLLYTSELKCPQSEPLAAKKQRVETVIAQLSMESCKHVTIGSPLKRGISGEDHFSPQPGTYWLPSQHGPPLHHRGQ